MYSSGLYELKNNSSIVSFKQSIIRLASCGVLLSSLFLISCGGTEGGTSFSPTSTSKVSIDAMTTVPVINGSSTQGTLYIHNYTTQTATGLSFSLNDQTLKSKAKSLLSGVGLKVNAGAVNKSGFMLLNSEYCSSIPAGGSCAINFSTPGLIAGDKGNSLVSLSYKLGGNTYHTNQVVNYQYMSLSALSGVNFTGSLNVVGSQGSTQHVVGYLYGGGVSGDKYTEVNLTSSSAVARISNGFINGQEVGAGQVIAVEFAVGMQENKASSVEIVPSWGGVKALNNLRLRNTEASGSMLGLTLFPEQGKVNYIFGTIPLLTAPTTSPIIINVTNNGNADASAGITATSDNAELKIDGNCPSTSLQANGTNSCTFIFSENSYTPGAALVTFKDSSNVILGTQNVIWTNNTPVPAVSITPSQSSFSIGKGEKQPESSISFTLTNVGNAPLNSISYLVTNTGLATWTQDGTTCDVSIAPSGSCSITGHFTGTKDGSGIFYQKVLGLYNSINYSFVSLPIRYLVTSEPSIVITPVDEQSFTILANGVESKEITYLLENVGSDTALVTNVFESYTKVTSVKPVIQVDKSSCFSNPNSLKDPLPSFALNQEENCEIVVSYGPAAAINTTNESGISSLNVDYHGGTPDVPKTTVSANLNYQMMGNDSSLTIGTPMAPNMPGNGEVNNPFRGNSTLNPMLITIPYTNNSSNYAMSNFNLSTYNLPFGLIVDPSTNCATGSATISLGIGESCNLVLKVDRNLLTNSPTGGASILNFIEPTASWTTPFGFYSQSGSSVYVNYLQATIAFSLSNNKGNFESTVLMMAAVNESSSTTLHGNVWSTKDWLKNAPVSPSTLYGQSRLFSRL